MCTRVLVTRPAALRAPGATPAPVQSTSSRCPRQPQPVAAIGTRAWVRREGHQPRRRAAKCARSPETTIASGMSRARAHPAATGGPPPRRTTRRRTQRACGRERFRPAGGPPTRPTTSPPGSVGLGPATVGALDDCSTARATDPMTVPATRPRHLVEMHPMVQLPRLTLVGRDRDRHQVSPAPLRARAGYCRVCSAPPLAAGRPRPWATPVPERHGRLD